MLTWLGAQLSNSLNQTLGCRWVNGRESARGMWPHAGQLRLLLFCCLFSGLFIGFTNCRDCRQLTGHAQLDQDCQIGSAGSSQSTNVLQHSSLNENDNGVRSVYWSNVSTERITWMLALSSFCRMRKATVIIASMSDGEVEPCLQLTTTIANKPTAKVWSLGF